MDNINFFAKNKKESERLKQAVRIYSQDRDGIRHRKCIMKSEKRHMTEGKEQPN